MRDLRWHLQTHRHTPGEGVRVPLEEALAVRCRLTGSDDLSGFGDVSWLDKDKFNACYAELAAQELHPDDMDRAFLLALSRREGDVPAAHGEMLQAFGKTPDAERALRLAGQWDEEQVGRTVRAAEALAAYRQAARTAPPPPRNEEPHDR